MDKCLKIDNLSRLNQEEIENLMTNHEIESVIKQTFNIQMSKNRWLHR